MDTIEFMNVFFSGLAWGGAIMFAAGLYGVGYFIDSYRDSRNKHKVVAQELRIERNKDV